MDDLACHLVLLRAPGVGPVAFARLVGRFGSPRAVLKEGPRDDTLPARLRSYLAEPDWRAAERDLQWAEGEDRHILAEADPEYPPRLRELGDAPPLLFVHGDVQSLVSLQLALVGSRNPTPGGRDTAFDFARNLARVGMAVTSGLALGIDAAAHRGALEASGTTVAVLGTGPDRIYPAANRDLARAVVDRGGALVTELPLGTGPAAANFPRRNRIISGMSLGVLVVEAALRSGSLITARLAAEQGREVFAIPGSIHNPLAKGCHRLLRQGARLVESVNDILEELAPQLKAELASVDADGGLPEPVSGDVVSALDDDYIALLEAVGYEATPVDILVERTQLTAEAVSSMLLILELQGLVAPLPGNRYSRTSKRA